MSASDAGFVKLFRSLLGHTVFRNDAEAMAFAWMVMRASWRPSKVRYKDRAITLKRGQLAVSVRDMASAMDRDKAWVERLWKRLKSETMIETVNDAGVSVVTICNYDIFQGDRDSSETLHETPNETGARQARDTEQRIKEIKNTSVDKSTSVARVMKFGFPCPAGVDELDWSALLENRKKKRAALSEGAHRQIVAKLDRWEADGWPPGPIVAQAAERGWTTVFETDEMKGSKNGQHGISRNDEIRDPMVRAILRRQAERATGSPNDFDADAGGW